MDKGSRSGRANRRRAAQPRAPAQALLQRRPPLRREIRGDRRTDAPASRGSRGFPSPGGESRAWRTSGVLPELPPTRLHRQVTPAAEFRAPYAAACAAFFAATIWSAGGKVDHLPLARVCLRFVENRDYSGGFDIPTEHDSRNGTRSEMVTQFLEL